MTVDLTRMAIQTRRDLKQQSNIELSNEFLTLTRTTTLTITTTGTLIVWQSEIRNNGFTWSGSQITIPSSGYYHVDMSWDVNTNTTYFCEMNVNGIDVNRMVQYSGGGGPLMHVSGTRYHTVGDIIQLKVTVGANRIMQVNPYNGADESPFLHIVKIA